MTLGDSLLASSACDHVAELVARHFGSEAGELTIGGIAVRALAAKHGTPLFVYDRAILESQLRLLRHTLPKSFDVFYSVKANPNQAILRFFVEQGCGLEIASSGELQQTLAAGCDPLRIYFAGPGKTEAELEVAVAAGIGELHVESLREAERLNRIARQHGRCVPIALRVNPAGDVEGGGMRMGGRPVPFGIDEDQLDEVLAAILCLDSLRVSGLHLYIGTQIFDPELLVRQYRAGVAIARRMAEQLDRPLTTLDFGGGLGVPYFAHERRLDLEAFRHRLAELADEIAAEPALASSRLVVEPGRFLVASSGVYVARVIDVKVSRGKKFLITDGGMHHHLAASGNLGQTIKRNFPVMIVNKLGDVESRETVDVVGPLCTPLDILARGIELPRADVGDLIGVFQSGAYARSASPLGFLSRKSPPEVLVEEGVDWLVRPRGTDQDFLRDQTAACLAAGL